uniref:VWFA domain-containing protein n=1 Tax=Arion vulgaris TaxID=1028688 RepID=A0A0B7BD61_9EUPU
MKMGLHVGAILVLISMMTTGTLGVLECSHNGQTYQNTEEFPHENGCAKYQCQFGTVVTYHEACGKEVDGNCYRLNFQFQANGQVYQCRKVLEGGVYVYKNEIAIPRIENCNDGGSSYQSLDKFKRGDECREYQCQNGVVVALDPACGRELDGNCHLLGETAEKDGTVYVCTNRTDDNAITFFEYKPVDPQPKGTRQCPTTAGTFQNFDIFIIPPLCHKRQCQNQNVKILQKQCAFKKDNITCKQQGEVWTQDGITYSCVFNETRQDPNAVILKKGFAKCKRSEQWYDTFAVHQRPHDCTYEQCQDGKTLPVQEGCMSSIDNQCHELNLVFKVKDTAFKCILNDEGLYRIVELDKDGNPIEKAEPTEAIPVFDRHCATFESDFIIVLDSSGSIVSTTFKKVLHFVSVLVSGFDIGPKNVRVGLLDFSDKVITVANLKDNDDFDSLNKSIYSTPFIGDTTNTHLAFNKILDENMFGRENGGRDEVPKIVIVITDGNSTEPEKTAKAAKSLQNLAEVIIIGVGYIKQEELNTIASRPEDIFIIGDYSQIFSLLVKLSEKTCEAIIVPTEPPPPPPTVPVVTAPPPPTVCPPVVVNPCQQVATRTADGFDCSCKDGYQVSANDSTQCEVTPCSNPIIADIIYVVDSSESIGGDNYVKALEFLVKLTIAFKSKPNDVRVACLVYSWGVQLVFDLSTFTNTDDIIKALLAAPYMEKSTLTHKGLLYIPNNELFSEARGGRPNAKDIVILQTDGASGVPNMTKRSADYVKSKGAHIITVGIGKEIKREELEYVASSLNATFYSESYGVLEYIQSELFQYACTV